MSEPTTTIYAVYQMLLCMSAGEHTNAYDMMDLVGQSHSRYAVSASLTRFAKDGMIRAVQKLKDKGGYLKLYDYVRTSKAQASFQFKSHRKQVGHFVILNSKVRNRQLPNTILPSKVVVEVEVHDRKYMTSLGW